MDDIQVKRQKTWSGSISSNVGEVENQKLEGLIKGTRTSVVAGGINSYCFIEIDLSVVYYHLYRK